MQDDIGHPHNKVEVVRESKHPGQDRSLLILSIGEVSALASRSMSDGSETPILDESGLDYHV